LDLNESNYYDFLNGNKFYLISLCSNKISRCSKLRNTLIEVSKRSVEEIGSEISIGMIEIDKQPNLAANWIDEGFATLIYVNQEEGEKEVYIGLKQTKNIMKFLTFKIKSDIEEVNSESELISSFNSNKIQNALLFLGSDKLAPFSISKLARAGREAGINKIYLIKDQSYLIKLKVEDFDVALFSAGTHKSAAELKRLHLKYEEDFSLKKLKNILMINIRNSKGYFSLVKQSDLELSFNKNVPTVFYIYADKNQLSKPFENEMIELAKKFTNEFLFLKSAAYSKTLKQVKFSSIFNFTREDLPALVLTNENPHNSDDVEKFYANQMIARRVKNMEGKINSTINETEKDYVDMYIAENFIDLYKKGLLSSKAFSEDENEMKMTGEFFVRLIDEALQEGNEVALLICPRSLKKFERIRKRFERTYQKVNKINENKILFDEIDPFYNEVSNINYRYYPSIALIKKNDDPDSPNNWNVSVMERGFTNEEIIKFIKAHTSIENFKVDSSAVERNSGVNEIEKKYKIYPVLKERMDGKLLSDNLFKFDLGYKRRWQNLKKNGIVSSSIALETGNEYEEDPDDNLEINDDINEEDVVKRDEL
jgi:hypothetical protein